MFYWLALENLPQGSWESWEPPFSLHLNISPAPRLWKLFSNLL